MERLQGKRILITGATSGVGLAAVGRFAREGADLALVARGEAALAQAVSLAREHGVEAHAFPADVSDRDAVNGAVEAAVEVLGGLDVVVSNAAAVSFGHFLEVAPDDFDRTVAITFTGAINVIRATLPELRASRGVLVVTSSLVAHTPLPTFSSYSAAKHGLRGFLNTLQVEEREQRSGVRVAMVSPGPVDTAIYARATSGTGLRPSRLPDAYHADDVAAALVEAAVRPRHERLVAGESHAVRTLYRHARPVAELLFVGVDRWFRSGTEPAESPGALWEGRSDARISAGMPARAAGDVVTFARHVAGAAGSALRIAPTLLRPVPERAHPLPAAHEDVPARRD
jgi:NAD(P)-dependent dehydrogenase (short-subunit alcohol dehydrogenase family)